jgi:hypothetical protein
MPMPTLPYRCPKTGRWNMQSFRAGKIGWAGREDKVRKGRRQAGKKNSLASRTKRADKHRTGKTGQA